MLQVKEQGKDQINQDQINEEEKRTLPEKEFRVMIVKMIQAVRNRREAQVKKIQEMFNKDPEDWGTKKSICSLCVINNTITEMENTLEGINSRITEPEEWISELEDRIVEITTAEKNTE